MSDTYDFPSMPPLPPDQLPSIALQASETPLTEKRWSLAAAFGFTVLTAAVTLGGGLLSAVLSAIPMVEGLSADARGAITGSVLIFTYGLLIFAVWFAARRSGVDFAPAVGLRPVPVLTTVGVALGIAFGARFLAGLYGLLLEALGVQLPGQNLDPTTLLPQTALGIALTIILACVVAPIAEELVFRGVLLSALNDRWGTTVAIWGSSVIFAAMHVLPYAIPPIFVLALLLGRLFVRSRSLWSPIVTHAIFNFIGLAAVYALRASGAL